MYKYKIAIITRTKDRPILLERAINSVLGQTFENWIHVIVNDAGNRPDIENLIEKHKDCYGKRVKLIYKNQSNGMEAASNTGIKDSDSEYIVILDDDDTWEPDFLGKTVTYLDENPEIGGVMTHSHYVIEKIEENKIQTLYKYPFNTDILNLNLFDCILKKVYPPTMSFVFRRSCYDELNGFNEEFLKSGDIEFAIRFLTRFDIDVIPIPLSNVHARPYNQDICANSSLGNKSYKSNEYWENKLKNHLLRMDLKENRVGGGFIYNVLTTLSPLIERNDIEKTLKNCEGKRIALYGAGIKAGEFLSSYKEMLSNMEIVGILDQNAQKHGAKLNGYTIFPPEKIRNLKPERILLTVANTTMVKFFVEDLIKKSGLNVEVLEFMN